MKTVVFDFDGTLTKKSNEIWHKMWVSIDALDIDYVLYCKYKNKEIDYVEWCEEIAKVYIEKGFNKTLLFDLSKEIELMSYLKETLIYLKERDYHLYIISGGVYEIIVDKLGDLFKYFDGIYACGFKFDSEGLLTQIIPTEYDDEGKKLFIDNYCKETKTTPDEITFIGNGDNDEYVYLSGCRTICINPHKKTNYKDKKIWHNVIDNCDDMRVILKFFEE